MNFISETIIRALCWTLLHSLWQGLILAIVAGAVMLLTKRAPSSTRYGLLGILVIGFLAVSGYTFFRELGSAGTQSPPIVLHSAPVVGTAGVSPVSAADQPMQPGGMGQLVQYFNTHASIVVVLWFIVFLARFVKLLSGVVYAQRVRHYQTSPVPAEWQDRLTALVQRLRISCPVRLLESALIKVPVAVGWLKPVILVPVGMLAQLSADQVESILLHELAHISRRDYLFNLVQNLVDTLFFFNPALLWVSSLIRTERENCCDDVAIRETRSRRQLIEALVSFHEYQQTGRGYVMGFAGEKNGMVKRVERIVHKRNHSLNAGERLLLMGGVLVLCGAFITINGDRTAEPIRVKTIVQPQTEVKVMTPVMKPVAMHKKRTVLVNKADTSKPDTAKPATLTKADIDLLIRARDHGVTPDYLAEMRQLGYSVSLEQAIRLRDHGVTADFIRDIQKEGYSQISLDKAVELIDHGVTPEFIHQVKAEGFPNLTLNEAVKLVDHGVNIGFIRDWKKKTGSQLELSDYIKLRDAGIDPS
jgi:beta-lactamase regulating signal transducer with metallopeptidase domain